MSGLHNPGANATAFMDPQCWGEAMLPRLSDLISAQSRQD